jgi:hypothetical protein
MLVRGVLHTRHGTRQGRQKEYSHAAENENTGDAEKYYWQLPGLIQEWRTDWGQGNFPFYVVQLPRMGISKVHIVRDAELQTAGRYREYDTIERCTA